MLLLIFAHAAYAQDAAPSAANRERDPVSLISSKLGDEDFELLLKGSWRAALSYSEGVRFNADGSVVFPAGFPGFTEGFYFEQVPALTFSVWLARRWFLEVSVASKAEDNTFLLGYRGKPGEFVRSVLVGNKDTVIGAYDFLDLPAQSKSSIGASALFTTPVSRHELLLRFDSTTEGKKVFIGKALVTERRISPAAFLRGRYFMLPDSGVENPIVYLEDKDGIYSDSAGHRYREAESNEIYLDTAGGFLFLLIDHQARIAVHYTKGGVVVGDASLGAGALPGTSGAYIDPSLSGTDFNWGVSWLGRNMADRRLTINARTCLLLWEPGVFSPFEMLSAYDLGVAAPADISKVRVSLVPKGRPDSVYPISPSVFFSVTPGRTFFIAYQNANTRADFRNHYPFPDSPPLQTRIGWQLYGPQLDHTPPFFEYEISIQADAGGAASYTLEPNVIPGSIRVTRNGAEETRYSYDANSYTLTFTAPILPYDRIEVTYRLGVSERNAGDIVFGWGNSFSFSPLASLEAALGLRWNILPGAYSETAYSKTGALVFSSALSGTSDHFSYRLSGALSYSNPDTTGVMRLCGMEGNGLTIEPSEDLGTPCAKPDDTEIPGLTQRGRLYYKNYRLYDSLGGSRLMSYDWTPPAEQIWNYASGSKPGPYLVSGDSQSANGQSLVLDFDLQNENDWVGIQLPVSYRNGTADLSAISAVIASLRAIDVNSGGRFDVYLQLGATGEDTDGDYILDAETSTLSSGYQFNDADNAVVLRVGGGPKNEGNGIINTEDLDGNGGLDAEDAGLMFTSQAVTFTGDTGWATYSFPVLDRNRLKKSRALRIIIVNRSVSGAASGRLLVDKLLLAGNGFWSNIDHGSYTSFTVEEVSERYASAPLLVDSFSEVRDIFHHSGNSQEVLKIQWSGGTDSPGWTVKTSLGSGVEGIRYRRLVFYLLRTNDATGDASVNLLDVDGKGVRCSFPAVLLSSGVWHKIELDLFDRVFSIDGAAASAATVSIDGTYGSLVFWSFSLASSSADGRLLIDEVHLRDPESTLGAAASFTGTLSLPGALLSVDGVPVLSDVTLTENATMRTAGFSTMYGRVRDEADYLSVTNVKAGVFFAGLEAEIKAAGAGDQFSLSGGHRLTLPRFDFPIVFTDRYAEKMTADGIDFSRENTLRVSFPNMLALGLTASAFSYDAVLSQNWSGNIDVGALAPYRFIADLQWSQSIPDFSRTAAWYLNDWIEAFSYCLPRTGESALARNFRGSVTQTFAAKPVGLKLAFMSGFASYDITDAFHRRKDELSLKVSVPCDVGISIEPYYSRSLTVIGLVPGAGSLAADSEDHFSAYAAYSYFFTMAPLYEILSPDVNDLFRECNVGSALADYKPEIGFSLTRRFGSSLLDLFFPSQIAFSYGKQYVLQGTLFNAFERISGTVSWNAINLFGTRGSYTISGLYAVDTFATSLKAGLTLREDRLPRSGSLSVESAYSFEAAGGDKLSIRNLFSVDDTTSLSISDKGGIDFTWRVVPPGGIALPLIDEKTARTGLFSHKESIDFSFTRYTENAGVHPVTVVVKHETAIQYPEFGYLRGEIALGYDEESYPEGGERKNIHTPGFRITLELNVKF